MEIGVPVPRRAPREYDCHLFASEEITKGGPSQPAAWTTERIFRPTLRLKPNEPNYSTSHNGRRRLL
jgi:hypothetical protein